MTATTCYVPSIAYGKLMAVSHKQTRPDAITRCEAAENADGSCTVTIREQEFQPPVVTHFRTGETLGPFEIYEKINWSQIDRIILEEEV